MKTELRLDQQPMFGVPAAGMRPRMSPYDLILLLTGTMSIVAMLLLVVEHFEVRHVVLLGAALAVLIVAAFRARVDAMRPHLTWHWWVLCGIWLLAVAFRMDLYPHFIAGQDQGLYVSMSEMMRRTHRLWFTDDLRQSLPAELRAIYDQRVLPGVVGPEPPKDAFYISFYPLHPAWMAVARSIFGFGFHTLSVFAFSLLALAGVYRLTRMIADDEAAATLALLFCAINPQLVFLSKFPLTETLAFAFTVNAAYSACRALQATSTSERWLHLTISLLLATALFYVRISFFVLVPLLCAAYVLSYGATVAQDAGRDFRRYTAFVLGSFILSLAYYDVFARQMSRDLLLGAPSSPLRATVILSMVAVLAILAAAGAFYSPRAKLRDLIASIEQRSLPYARFIVPVMLALAVIPAYAAIETGKLAWTFNAPPGFANIKYSLLYRLLLIASPLLVVYLLVPRLQLAIANARVLYLTLFFAGAWLITLAWVPTLPYLYYHGRYISAEVLPSLIMLASITLASQLRAGARARRWAVVVIAGTAVYGLLWSGAQLGEIESDRPEFVAEIDRQVGPRDLLIVAANEIGADVATPLRTYLGKNLFYIGEELARKPREVENVIASLLERRGVAYDRVLLLSPPTGHRYKLDLEQRSTVHYESSFFTNGERAYQSAWRIYPHWPSFLLPAKNVTIRRDFALYEVKAVPRSPPSLGLGCMLEFSANGLGREFLDEGWSDQEPDYIWSDGPAATITGMLQPVGVRNTALSLRLTAHAYVGAGEKQRIAARLNGVVLGTADVSSLQVLVFDVPAGTLGQAGEWTLQLQFPDAHSPRSRGAGADPRLLGVGMHALAFEDPHAGPRTGRCP